MIHHTGGYNLTLLENYLPTLETQPAVSYVEGTNTFTSSNQAAVVYMLSFIISPLVHLFSYLDVQGGEVAVEVFRVVDVRLPADWTHHVSNMFVPYSNSEVLLETATAHRTLT